MIGKMDRKLKKKKKEVKKIILYLYTTKMASSFI